jgi:valyl-tRNA synthetase
VEKIWEWKEKHGGIIIQQLKKLGASCDWSRERFTMDPDYSAACRRCSSISTKGLIYRGKRMVNWCPSSLTALSDEEVVMKEQKGFMYHFKVEVVEEPGTFLTIATTRPERSRRHRRRGQSQGPALCASHRQARASVRCPSNVTRAALIPIIADEHVDFEFGTGVLKVTPAHDKADFEIGQRHNLPVIDVMHPTAR